MIIFFGKLLSYMSLDPYMCTGSLIKKSRGSKTKISFSIMCSLIDQKFNNFVKKSLQKSSDDPYFYISFDDVNA